MPDINRWGELDPDEENRLREMARKVKSDGADRLGALTLGEERFLVDVIFSMRDLIEDLYWDNRGEDL
jgi:hypothetical protein